MRLPVLNTNTSAPTPLSFEAAEYFNPTINPYFDAEHLNGVAREGCITLQQSVSISKAILALNDIEELVPSIASRYVSSISPNILNPLYRKVYDILPEDKKYLIFSTVFHPNGSIRTHADGITKDYSFFITMYYPIAVSYLEVQKSNYKFDFEVTLDAVSNTSFTEAQTTALTQALANIPNLIDESFKTFSNNYIYSVDRMVPHIVNLIYTYTNDNIMYAPKGNEDDFSVAFDYYRPSMMLRFLTDDNLAITFNFPSPHNIVTFTEAPAEGNRKKFEKIFSYSTDVLTKLPYTIKGPKEQASTLYGVELEANSKYPAREVIQAQKDLFFLLKQDSSIFGEYSNNYEMVTIPCTLRAHKRLWAEFFESIDYTKFDTSKSTGNGMHVHIDRKAFSKKHLNKFTWFFIAPGHSNFIFLMSERATKEDLNKWAGIASVSTHSYSKYYRAARSASTINRGRGAVHYKGSKTVEIRIFKGIVSYATIVKNLEFVDSVVEYTRWESTDQISLSRYFFWLDNHTPKNKYELLKAYYAEFKLEPYVTAAELDKLLWGITREDLIVKKLNSAPFKVTNAHITILNKKRKKRTFVLKDGVVTSLVKNSGVLAKLDQLAQKKQTRGAATFLSSSY